MARILGIDVGTHAVRGAVVRTSFGKFQVERYLEVPIAPLGEDGSPEAALQVALRELVDTVSGESSPITVVALDGRKVSLRHVSLPAAAAKRTAEVLPFELDPLLPFPVEDSVVDYQQVATREGELHLLACAAPRERVGELLSLLSGAGLDPREMAAGGACLEGLTPVLEPQNEAEAWLMLHVSDSFTDVCILKEGHCELGRTLDEGFERLRQRPEAMQRALLQTLAKFRAEGGPAPTRLLVSGEVADDEALVEWFGQLLGLPAEAVRLPGTESAPGAPSPRYGRALALATRSLRRGKRINLRQGEFASSSQDGMLRQYAGLASVCAAAILLTYVFAQWAEYRALDQQREALAEQLEEVTKERFDKSTRSPRRAQELLEGGGRPTDPLPSFDALRMLAAVSDAVPEGMTHDARKVEVQLDDSGFGGSFEIQGSLPDLTARDQVANRLEEHECIQALDKGRTSTVPGQDRKNYTLEGEFVCPGMPKSKKKGR